VQRWQPLQQIPHVAPQFTYPWQRFLRHPDAITGPSNRLSHKPVRLPHCATKRKPYSNSVNWIATATTRPRLSIRAIAQPIVLSGEYRAEQEAFWSRDVSDQVQGTGFRVLASSLPVKKAPVTFSVCGGWVR
jgi:hypothetical protein